MRWNAIPWVVYTDPEVAGAGLSEAQAKEQGRAVRVAKLDMRANARFVAESDGTRGMVKVVVDAASDLVLGVQMIGAVRLGDRRRARRSMIESELRARDVREIVFPHPTVSRRSATRSGRQDARLAAAYSTIETEGRNAEINRIDPREVRSAGTLKLADIPLNAYVSDAKKEEKKYGRAELLRMYHDMVVIREFETMLNTIKTKGA